MWLLRICIFSYKFDMIFLLFSLNLLLTSVLPQTIDPAIKPTINDGKPIECPYDWVGDGNTCYFLSDYRANWNSAREFCNYLESDLVILSDESIQRALIIHSERPSISVHVFWIGLNDLNSPGNFKWVDESDPTFTNWSNDTDNAVGNCVMLDVEDQKWKVANCSSQYGFVCSKQGMFNESVDFKECEEGMKRFVNSCYWTVPGGNNWQSAENWCETENGKLTTISSSLENIFVYSFVRQEIGSYWIGLYVDENGNPKWENEKENAFSNWDGQPAISSGLCTVLERNGKWAMQPCDAKILFGICEKPVSGKNVSTKLVETKDAASCPQSWVEIEDGCYLVVTVPMTWDTARNECLSLGADLVSMKNQEEESRIVLLVKKFVNESANDNFWLGLRMTDKTDLNEWKWTDQSQLLYTNWNSFLLRENLTVDAEKFCGVYETITNQWTIEPCSLKSIFVCEAKIGRWNLSCDNRPCRPTTRIDSTNTPFTIVTISEFLEALSTKNIDDYYPKTNPCPPDWQIFDDKCYLIKGEDQMENVNWTTASYQCRSRGEKYDLVSIHSSLEHEFLLNQLKSFGMDRAWIGLNDKAVEGQFVWSDGSPVDYTDWAWQDNLNADPTDKFSTTARNFMKITPDCVKIEMTAIAGKWTANDCNIQLGYVCQKLLTSSVNSTPQIPLFSAISASTIQEIQDSDISTTDDLSIDSIITTFANDIKQEITTTETVNDTNDVTEQNMVSNEVSLLVTSDTSVTNNEEVPPFDVDNLVTTKCDSDSRMTSGTIAGITLSCILAAVLIVIAFFHWRRRRAVTTHTGTGKFSFDNALYNPHADNIQLDTNVPPASN